MLKESIFDCVFKLKILFYFYGFFSCCLRSPFNSTQQTIIDYILDIFNMSYKAWVAKQKGAALEWVDWEPVLLGDHDAEGTFSLLYIRLYKYTI